MDEQLELPLDWGYERLVSVSLEEAEAYLGLQVEDYDIEPAE